MELGRGERVSSSVYEEVPMRWTAEPTDEITYPMCGHQKRERDRTDCWSFYPLLSLYRMGVAERDGQKPREREVVVVVGEFND